VEWMIPPLWPLKAITLPARGPRPSFKGEEILTLRLMDDVVVPKMADARPPLPPGWHRFGESSTKSQSSNDQRTETRSSDMAVEDKELPSAAHMTVIALKSNNVFDVVRYRVELGRLLYILANGERGSVATADVDWTKTSRLNLSRSATTLMTRIN